MIALRHFLLAAALLLPVALPAAIEVTARFDPPRIALGDRSQYIVEISESSGGGIPQPERITRLPLPAVEGMTLRGGRVSTSQQTSIVNGVAEHRITQQLLFDAVPQTKRRFTVPAFALEYKGATLTVPAADLLVIDRNADAAPTVDELIFLEAGLPDTLYVGQSVEVPLTLYVSQQVELQDLGNFSREGDGFSVSDLPAEAERGTTVRDGRRYITFRWPLKVTPLSAGSQAISFRFDVLARLPERPTSATAPSGPLSLGMLDEFFVRPQRFSLYTRDQPVEVRSLPAENRPDGFTGAIGDLGLRVFLDREETREGEPVMLSVIVSGKGNFDRIGAPQLGETDDWRRYPPEDHFEAGDALGLQGSKRFDFVLLPNRTGTLEVPGVEFAFFDPEIGDYIGLSSPALEVAVTSAAAAPATAAGGTEPTGSPDGKDPTPPPASYDPLDRFLAVDFGYRPAAAPATSLLDSLWFPAANGVALLAFGAVALTLWHRHHLARGSAAIQHEASAELRKVRREADERAEAGDVAGFHAAAQKALRLAATRRIGRPFHAASHAELATALDSVNLPPATRSALAALARESDDLRFSGANPRAADLERSRQQLDQVLRAL